MKYLNRQLELPINQSFFLFGARNTGKSTLIKMQFQSEKTFWIDLLDPTLEDTYARDSAILAVEVRGLPSYISHVVIDEIQKIPKLLDVVHSLIESTNKIFILTGSSARKLEHGGANLLAGRAFVYHLFPFTVFELGLAFNLEQTLKWGSLPMMVTFTDDDQRLRYLQAYTLTYLKEEIWMEQFVRKLDPFRKFLEVSAQNNGKIINFRNIGRDVGVDEKTVKHYYSILEDTLIGFFLEGYVHSFRKRLSLKPKFYYFDTGVVRALTRTLSMPLQPATSSYGEAFEHYIILEAQRLASYYWPEYRFSYLKTKDDSEIDLVVERPGDKILFIEIKSSKNVKPEDLTEFKKLIADFGECTAVCFSQNKMILKYDTYMVYPWQLGLQTFFMRN